MCHILLRRAFSVWPQGGFEQIKVRTLFRILSYLSDRMRHFTKKINGPIKTRTEHAI